MHFSNNKVCCTLTTPKCTENLTRAPRKMSTRNEWESNEEINIFCEYLRIPSVHPDVNYGKSNI